MNRLKGLINKNFSMENSEKSKEIDIQEYIEIIDLLTKYGMNYKFNSFISLSKFVIKGIDLINNQKLLNINKFWNILNILIIDPLQINNDFKERPTLLKHYCNLLLEKSFSLDSYDNKNWKLLLLINRYLFLQNLKDIFLNSLIRFLRQNSTLMTLIMQMKNFQQLIFFIEFLTMLNIINNSFFVDKKNNQNSKLLKFLTTNNKKLTITQILNYIITNNMIPENSQIFQPTKILHKLSEDDEIDNCINTNTNFSIIQAFNNSFYLWSDKGICLEFNENDSLKIFKNLKDEIIIDVSNSNFEIINNDMSQSREIKRIKYFHLIFESDQLRNQLLSLICNKRPKISKSIGTISLNYLDFEDDNNEVTQGSEDIITSLPDAINNMINENNKEQAPKPLTQSIITPDASTDHSGTLDEWKINETSQNEPIKEKNINDEQENRFTDLDDPIKITDPSLPTVDQSHQSIDKIGKIGKIGTNIKNQNVPNQVHKVNKKAKVTNNNSDKNISILNKIFQVDTKNTNKTHRNKIQKKKPQLSRQKKQIQKHLSNVKQIITIPSQDISQKVTSNKQNEIQNDQNAFTDGPAQRTRNFQSKRSLSTEYKTPVKIVKVSSKKISKESEKSIVDKSLNHDKHNVTDEPPSTDFSHKDTQKNDDHILQESTTIVNTTPFPKQTLSINTSSLLDPQSFTNVLQAQINNSVATFSNELTKKLTIINDEMNNTILKDLSIKYQGLIDELKVKFNNDTTNILHFVSDFQHLLLLPEDQLRTAIRDQFEATKYK